ncbi:hypothetical protein RJ640_010637 [Escallonia rubra]|uniref:Uncharacterized protein n=1 Tax=Escallonia rubra TaxID=112253 RepID=A0AA88U820_9ASTE|nr:hypothetical protein RJ640_010637 [Escallonia rubra]
MEQLMMFISIYYVPLHLAFELRNLLYYYMCLLLRQNIVTYSY